MLVDRLLASRKKLTAPKLDHPLYLYGQGKLGHLAQEFFKYVGCEIAGVFDQGTPVLPDRQAQVAVCVVEAPLTPIVKSLYHHGFMNVVPFYDLAQNFCGQHPLAENGWFADPLTPIEQGKVTEVLERWDDHRSRKHHLQFIAWRRLREEWDAPVSKADMYFIPEVRDVLHDNEVFLDGGAYPITNCGEFNFKATHAVEPDDNNCKDMVPPAKGQFFIHNYALAEKDGTMPFCEGFGLASRLSPYGTALKRTRSIDSLSIEFTFIKLHLEGGELAALRGAEKTLIKHRPILAVLADHNADGIWRTAAWLMDLLKDYRFLFRNHCWCGSAAVIYAIPYERARA